MAGVQVHPEVVEALRAGRPVVALESAVITHGVLRTPLNRRPLAADPEWAPERPTNLELARLLERTVRGTGAVPATVCVLRGTLHVGLERGQIEELADDPQPTKAAARDLAWCLTTKATAGLTVAGTLEACTARALGDRRISCFATGGIGGAHRGWAGTGDISADLAQIATRQVCVVCAGPKAILDVAATTELLDTLGVPVLGCGTWTMPRFICPPQENLRLPARVDDPASIAALCHTRWSILGQPGGVLVAQPVRADLAIDEREFLTALASAEASLTARHVRGPEVTPALLEAVAEATSGRSLEANIALLVANAALAGRIAGCLCEHGGMA